MNVSGEKVFDAPRATVWQVLNDPAAMAKTMPDDFTVGQSTVPWYVETSTPSVVATASANGVVMKPCISSGEAPG